MKEIEHRSTKEPLGPFWAIAALAVLISASACTTPEQQAAHDQRVAQIYHDQCASMGAVTQDQFFNCRLQLQQADAARSEAYGRRMQAVGAQMLMGNPQPQQYPRTVTCRSVPEGIVVRTVCN